jgi:hypothetical protein
MAKCFPNKPVLWVSWGHFNAALTSSVAAKAALATATLTLSAPPQTLSATALALSAAAAAETTTALALATAGGRWLRHGRPVRPALATSDAIPVAAAPVAASAVDTASSVAATSDAIPVAAALATAAFGAPSLRLHFLRLAQLPRVCDHRGRHLHHRRLHRQHLRAVQPGCHVRRRLVPATARLPRMHQLICGQLPLVSQPG